MKRDNVDQGYPEAAWQAAKAEARAATMAVEARRRLIPYSELVAEIRSLDLERPAIGIEELARRRSAGMVASAVCSSGRRCHAM
ncbi:MAG: hypothetical protein OXH15_21690 [Gammaproteobacteria bacterium]|nr:hypothetical protein [Gammaproteobacteria bacterium]